MLDAEMRMNMKKKFYLFAVLLLVMLFASTALADMYLGNWSIKSYIDEFNEPTGNLYVTNKYWIEGTFNNSAANNRPAYMSILDDNTHCAIVLYEYDKNSKVKNYSTETYTVKIKGETGILNLTGTIYEDGDRLYLNDPDNFVEMLSNNSSVSIYIQSNKYSLNTYLFNNIKTDGFAEADQVLFASPSELTWYDAEYQLSDDKTYVTAIRHSKYNYNLYETETTGVAVEITKAPTCTEAGETTYTSEPFENSAFTAQKIVLQDVDPTGHTLTAHARVEPTCTDTGSEAYWECKVCKKLFSDNEGKTEIEKPIEIAEKGHDWNKAEYVWSEDNSSVEAKRTCKTDSTHIEMETVLSELAVVSPTNEKSGTATYSAVFENKAFEKQTKEITIPALNKLSVMNLPSSIKTIEDESFTNLSCQAIIIPDGCTTIGKKAFSGCRDLLYIKIPASVKNYPDSAFEDCNKALVIDWVKK